MRTSITTLLYLLSVLVMSAQTGNDVLAAMEKANSYFIAKYPDAGAPTFVKKVRPSNLWTRGVYFEGLCELVSLEPEGAADRQKSEKYIRDWGHAHRWVPRDGVRTRDADNYCCCQTYLRWAESLEPTIECMDNLLDNPESVKDWTWIDAIQMGLPVLTRLSKVMRDRGYKDFARYAEHGWRMYSWTRNTLAGGLFNETDGLWWRDKDFVAPYKTTNGKQCYWSRGNGWVYAALVRAMSDIMSTEGYEGHFGDYKHDFIIMTDALVKCQRKDLFWNVSLADEDDFGGKELTGTALFVYGMAWGVNNGILPEKPYRKLVMKTWKAMVRHCLRTDGSLGYVQGTGKQPSDSQPVTYESTPDFEDFGLGCFLLAGAETFKLINH
ncbi:MAG: glycoside hydrolase family 88 protein [Bacteroidaceae bacterium]|nr:glycoside hydrolase family 88 protein [Bacteroidaceae bacterium]